MSIQNSTSIWANTDRTSKAGKSIGRKCNIMTFRSRLLKMDHDRMLRKYMCRAADNSFRNWTSKTIIGGPAKGRTKAFNSGQDR